MADSAQRYDDFVWLFEAWQRKRLEGVETLPSVSFYRDLAREVDGPALEVGVGVGRVYLELLADGVDIDGIDLSAGMLDRLRERAADRGLDPSVGVADVTDFEPDREYGLVYMARSFKYLTSLADQRAALRTVRDVLAPDGVFALDARVPRYETIAEDFDERVEETVEVDGETYRIVTYIEFEDEVEGIARWHLEGYHDGRLLDEHSVPMATTPKRQFELLFELAGFDDWTAYGDYDRSPLGPADEKMIWVVEP